ncbi:methyltransferase domain-containing protein [Nitrosopumilus sp.]|uniref:methyltransferase domain-containing protein n=1 Tax=Nitrosopumilus sp. TaxID=2024843 RepID=UPI00247B9CE1|nr:methyltransferase domain-containing protein [Nitrosopumilus sp.]MCV0430363.1 methyltransferase domain-containing protein [Nitrosopumilus sp.]
MKDFLVEHLICPKCSKKLVLKSLKKKKDEIIEGNLICLNKHKFPIKDGIPRLVVDTAKTFVDTENSFSSKWKKYNKTYHTKNWINGQKKWFLERFGWKTTTNFNKFLKTRTKILDAGTGVGNSAKLFSSNPDAQVFAIDASESVLFAYKKYGNLPNVHFLQADIRKLPFKKNFFDFICSDQVLHHTKDTESSFKMLTKLLAKKGLISIYVYKIKGPIREFADTFIRESTVKMTEKQCIELSKDMAILGKNLSKINKKITIPKDIPVLNIKKGTYDVQRFIYWNFLKCWWSGDVPFEQSVATNFDWYFPEYAYRHSVKEVKKWFKDSKLKISHFNEIESGISVNGQKN